MAAVSPNGAGPVSAGLYSRSVSPRTVAARDPPSKRVNFVIKPPHRGREKMRVDIAFRDTTESIMTSVKTFFGIHTNLGFSEGLSLEGEHGNTIIARYENFQENGTVYVRIIEEPIETISSGTLGSAQGVHDTNGYPLQGTPQLEAHAARPASWASQLRSPSPNGGRGRRSTSTAANLTAGKKGRSRSSKTRTEVNGHGLGDSFSSYTNGDGAAGSSGRSKEPVGNTDISVENIVEGGRRKRTKFESAVSCRVLVLPDCIKC